MEGIQNQTLNTIGVLIGDEPGLGKTIQAIGVINADPTIKNVLIVCPASLQLNWKREIERWCVRELEYLQITSWDMVKKQRAMIDSMPFDLVVVDEAHYGKNPESQRSKAVYGAPAKGKGEKRKPEDLGIQGRRKLALTGTPIPNRPKEIHPCLRWLHPGEFGNFWPFGIRYCAGHQGDWGWDFDGASNLDELQNRLRGTVMVRRLKEDVLTELPAKRRQIILLDASAVAHEIAEENKAYEEQVDDLDGEIEVSFAGMSQFRHQTAVAKIPQVVEHVKDVLDGGTGKLVVFCHHHDVVYGLQGALAEYGTATLTGETSLKDRQEAVDRFQKDPSCRVFIGSITAAGVGISLTAASHVVFGELDFVPGNV
ncbi:MAG: DEAD/DEAH box helicase, partial [bacterium]|nr:DEAD/DEAH box helicase [bacterium]